MERLINWILSITTIISLYIILCIGLDWFWLLGYSDNSEKINQVLINLSYSYIAGFIFYLLVTHLPYAIKKDRLKPVIKLKINNLYIQINAFVQTFETEETKYIINVITKEDELKEIVNKNGMYANSFYANVTGLTMNNFQFLVETRKRVISLIDSLVVYRDYLETNQILNIEKIRDSGFLNLVTDYEDTPIIRFYYSSVEFRTDLIEELFKIIVCVKELKQSV